MQTSFLNHISLLYVEDEDSIREFMHSRLLPKVKQLYVARDGQEGLDLYGKHTPDIVLTDISMPKLDGISMAKKIKEQNEKATIIVMSAHSDTNYLLEAIELGVNHYLLKPINKKRLFETLESCAKAIFLEQELAKKERQLLHQTRFALLGEMTSMLAHQWRQPLNVISLLFNKLQLEIEIDKYDLDDMKQRELFLTTLFESFEKISSQIQDLSNLIDSFRQTYIPSEKLTLIDINSVVQKSVVDFKRVTSSEVCEVVENYSATKSVPIYVNEFLQICLNLLNNVKEHFQEKSFANPYIIVSTHDCENGVLLEVLDNAGGVDTDIISKIFDPYFSTKEGKNGNGLGLYISKLIIEEHMDGEIFVKNEEEGAKFSIRLFTK